MTAGSWIASRRTSLPLKTRAARSGLKAITATMRRIEGNAWEKRRSGRTASGTKNLLASKRADCLSVPEQLRIELSLTFGTQTVREGRLGMVADVGFQDIPGTRVIADFFAGCADRKQAMQ